MKGERETSLTDRLGGIVTFLPRFQVPGFKLGIWRQPPSTDPSVFVVPYFSLSGAAKSFVQTAYDLGWVLFEFDWSTWMQTAEAEKLRDDADALAQATPEQLARLLTVCIRQDRFVEGALQSAFDSGLLMRILQRAAVILAEIEPSTRAER